MIRLNIQLLIALICLLAFPGSQLAADAAYTPRIIGGNEAQEGAWPSAVALVKTGSGSLYQRQFCGGNVIASQWVVTAAHCLHDQRGEVYDASYLNVALGVTNLANEQSATEIGVTNIIIYPGYDHADERAYRDLAMLELSQPTVQPMMELFTGNIESLTGNSVVTVGWGTTVHGDGRSSYPTILNQVTLPLVSIDECNAPESYAGDIEPGQFCAGFKAGGKDSCLGDSGGPIMLTQNGVNLLTGVVSFGRGCALANQYGIYTDVSYYRSWINDLIMGVVPAPVPDRQEPQPDRIRRVEEMGGALDVGGLLLLLLWARRRYAVTHSIANPETETQI